MIFRQRTIYGKDFFYPISIDALRFVDAFPGSSGKRKCLTMTQFQLLIDVGIKLYLQPYKEGESKCEAIPIISKRGRNHGKKTLMQCN